MKSISGAPVYVRDVANVVEAPREDQAREWREARVGKRLVLRRPAVSLAIAKRKGANAVVVAQAIRQRVESLKGRLIPDSVEVSVTRDYGESANEKANELLQHLGLATLTIVALIGFAIGWREAGVTAVVIPTTILLTLFASNLMGYTINRVSLFALIFSIGILVDDAIVVIENIARHWAMDDGRSRSQAAVEAVAEVGNPTVVATLTVVTALLPMLFVSGLMGPYMAPIPVNASAAMVFSFFVAMVIAPWLMVRFARKALADEPAHAATRRARSVAPLSPGRRPGDRQTRRSAWIFLGAVGVATLARLRPLRHQDGDGEAVALRQQVRAAGDDGPARGREPGGHRTGPGPGGGRGAEPAGGRPPSRPRPATASPFNFNGLVRHYYLRNQPELGDLAIQLTPKGERHRASHAIARGPAPAAGEARLAGRNLDQGGRGAARAAGAGDPAGRESTAPTPRPAARSPTGWRRSSTACPTSST